MSLPSREQRILDAIEYHLRVSDPGLVSSFGRLARNTRGGWLRAVRRWRYRRLAGRARTPGGHRSLGGTPVLAFIPVFMLAVLSLMILLVPGNHQRVCEAPRATVWVVPRLSGCTTGREVGRTVSRGSGRAYPTSPGSYLPARIRRLAHP